MDTLIITLTGGVAILAGYLAIRNSFLSGESEGHYNSWAALSKKFAKLDVENAKLKAKLSRSYHTQYRVNGQFAKRPDPIVEAYKNDPIVQEYKAACKAYGHE